MPIGDGGARVDPGDSGTGRPGSAGNVGWPPTDESGEARSEGAGERCDEGELDERVDVLNGCTGLMLGLRMGSGEGREGKS
jgi:hypothetical protein